MMAGFRRSPTVLMAAFSNNSHGSQLLHELLPGTWNANFERFQTTLVDANVGRIGFLRHGQTAKSQGVDFDRILTDHGRDQASAAGSSFGRELKPFYRSVFCSPAPRTVETANIFLNSANETRELVTPQTFYDGTMQPKGSQLFKMIGYAPLDEYLNHPDGQCRSDAQNVLGAYSHSVIDTIFNEVQQHNRDGFDDSVMPESTSTLWMVGHAIYLPAAALGVASLIGCADCSVFLSCNTKEAEGYLIDLETSSTTYLARPESANH